MLCLLDECEIYLTDASGYTRAWIDPVFNIFNFDPTLQSWTFPNFPTFCNPRCAEFLDFENGSFFTWALNIKTLFSNRGVAILKLLWNCASRISNFPSTFSNFCSTLVSKVQLFSKVELCFQCWISKLPTSESWTFNFDFWKLAWHFNIWKLTNFQKLKCTFNFWKMKWHFNFQKFNIWKLKLEVANFRKLNFWKWKLNLKVSWSWSAQFAGQASPRKWTR